LRIGGRENSLGAEVRPARRDVRVVAGVLSYILTSALIVLLATAYMSAEDYTIFMAYTSVVGVVILGPAAAIEQHSTLLSLRTEGTVIDVGRRLVNSVLGLAVCVALVSFVPIQDWQTRAFGSHSDSIKIVMVVAVPLIVFSSIVRGHATGLSEIAKVGNSHFVFAGATLAVSLLAWACGMTLLRAVLLGQLIGWVAPGLFLVAFRKRGSAPVTASPSSAGVTRQSVLLVVTNLLILANILASPFVFRLRADDLGVNKVAEAQLVMSVSFVACALVLGLLPTFIQDARRLGFTDFVRRPLIALLVAGSLLLPVLAMALSTPAVRILQGRAPGLSHVQFLAVSLPAPCLVFALILGATMIANERLVASIAVWGSSLVSLALSVLVVSGAESSRLPFAVALGFVVAPVLMWVFARRRPGSGA
jgi:hypothetical protein